WRHATTSPTSDDSSRPEEMTSSCRSKIKNPKSKIAFTLVEMLTTVAVLVIVLGLMVSLARDVRTRSADRLTKDLLHRLDSLVAQYRIRSLKGLPEDQKKLYPIVFCLFAGVTASTDESTLRA